MPSVEGDFYIFDLILNLPSYVDYRFHFFNTTFFFLLKFQSSSSTLIVKQIWYYFSAFTCLCHFSQIVIQSINEINFL